MNDFLNVVLSQIAILSVMYRHNASRDRQQLLKHLQLWHTAFSECALALKSDARSTAGINMLRKDLQERPQSELHRISPIPPVIKKVHERILALAATFKSVPSTI